MEERPVGVPTKPTQHGEKSIRIGYELVFLDEPACLIGKGFLVLRSKSTSYIKSAMN